MFVRYGGLAVVAGTAAALIMGAPAQAAPGHRVAYVRAGSIYVLSGTTEARLTRDADDTRPRWSPDGTRIAFGHAGRLWVMNADGTGRQAVATGATGGADWSPDGRWLAFAAPGCTGVEGVFKVSATGGAPAALFPATCRGTAQPAAARQARASGDLPARLRADSAVAWSPDGTKIAFRGGECLATVDDCLTLGDVASGAERVIAAYGGGGQVFSGFAVIPSWRPDGQRLAWTSAQQGETTLPVHVVEATATGEAARTVGAPLDRELTYLSATTAVLTGQYHGTSWLFTIDLAAGTRTPLAQGSQPDVWRAASGLTSEARREDVA
jgi:dipeptidyl aminopeptidase/acylaminoacyl peptidase